MTVSPDPVSIIKRATCMHKYIKCYMIHYNIPYISVQQNFGTIHKDDRDTVYVYTTGAFDDRAHIGSNILHDTLQHTAVRAPSVLGIAVSMGRSLFTNTLEKRPENTVKKSIPGSHLKAPPGSTPSTHSTPKHLALNHQTCTATRFAPKVCTHTPVQPSCECECSE